MKNIIVLLMFLSPFFMFSQSVEKIKVCDDIEMKKWVNSCIFNLDTDMKEDELKFYKNQCIYSGKQNFCEWKKVIIMKNDTIYCATTEKKKYIKICNE